MSGPLVSAGAVRCVQGQLLRLGQVGERMVEVCEQEMESCRDWLTESGACNSSSVYQVGHPPPSADSYIGWVCVQVLTDEYLPLAEKLAEENRSELKNIEVCLFVSLSLFEDDPVFPQQSVEAHIAQHQSWFHSVLEYGMGAAQLWRDHSTAVAEVKRSREKDLAQLREEHDRRNQNGEANLDLVLDHMRQAPNEEVMAY